MARNSKIGLSYFPLDTTFFQDIKIRKLIKYQGGKAISVYAYLLCNIYDAGYYIRWDDELPFMISEVTGYDEAYIHEAIKVCVNVGLFSKEMFEQGIVTSKGIQERYMMIVQLSKRKAVVSEFNLISSEETGISSEEIPLNSEFGTQRKVKESKVNKKEEDPPTPVPGDPPVLELFEKPVEPPKPTAPKPVKPSPEKIDPPKNGIDPSVIREVVTRFNNLCTQLPKVEVISDERKKAIRARISDYSIEQVYKVIELTSKSKFLNGQNDRNWSASFDWIFSPKNFLKVLELNYNKDLNGFKISNQQPSAGSARAKGFSVSPEYLRGIVADLQSAGND